MNHLRTVLAFGWRYFQRYWVRLFLGILLGVLFGLSNGAFVWATKTLIGRMSPEPAPITQTVTNGIASVKADERPPSALSKWRDRLQEGTEKAVDPWLPRFGRPIDTYQFIGGVLFLPFLVALRGFLGYFSSYCMAWVSEKVVNDLRVDVVRKFNTLSLDFFNRSTMGDLITRVNGDTAALQRCLNTGFSDLIKEPVTILSIFVMLCLLDWKLTLMAMIFFPLCVLPIIILGKKIRRASKAGVQVTVNQSSFLVEVLSSIRVVKAFGLEGEQESRFRKLSGDLSRYTMKYTRARELTNPLIETISMVGLGLLIVYIAYRQRPVDEMVAFLTGMVFFYTPVKKLAGLHALFELTSAGVARLMQILNEQPSVKEPASPKPFKQFTRELQFDNVTFGYRDTSVLQSVQLTLPRGMKLGVAGESGSGKSTLTNLIYRFYDPTSGAVRIDGLDLREISSSDLRQQLALVSQDVVIFDQTVAENIACGHAGATREDVEAAARAAFAHDFILQLPEGYETRVGERGVTLSGGQRQRISIARAFVRNAPILVLDEATASLDSKAEAEVQAAIDRLAENRTVVCVAHRLSTLRSMDRIIVLSEGRIVEQGSFEELLRLNGYFTAMAQRQGITASPNTSVV